MTPTQQKTYDFITEYRSKHGRVPSTIITARHFNISPQAVSLTYKALVALKKLRKQKVAYFELSTSV